MLFTSESVSCGHPDKMSDLVSDSILDALLQQDPHARVAVESLFKSGTIILAGEITTDAWVDVESIARSAVKHVGYTHPDMGFDYRSCGVLSIISQQSQDISDGIEQSRSGIGAGDQGIMFGYACIETPELMPAPIMYAHALMRAHFQLRQSVSDLWPDAKSQVTCEYNNGQLVRISDVVLSSQHPEHVELEDLRQLIKQEIIYQVLPEHLLKDTKFHINPAGRFVCGGPKADCGLTGRKIIVDTYGGASRHGGGCFSGKDATKVDRSGAYMARFLAKNVVAAGLAQRCEVQIAYAIGEQNPVSVFVDTFGTSEVSADRIVAMIMRNVDLSPQAIIERFDLNRPIYAQTACYGHFGNETYPWESIVDGLLD